MALSNQRLEVREPLKLKAKIHYRNDEYTRRDLKKSTDLSV